MAASTGSSTKSLEYCLREFQVGKYQRSRSRLEERCWMGRFPPMTGESTSASAVVKDMRRMI